MTSACGQVSSLSMDSSADSPVHVMQETLVSLCFRFKVSGELPLLHVKISDQKIQNVLDLVYSIPLPNMGSSPSTPTGKVHLIQSGLTVATPTGRFGCDGGNCRTNTDVCGRFWR